MRYADSARVALRIALVTFILSVSASRPPASRFFIAAAGVAIGGVGGPAPKRTRGPSSHHPPAFQVGDDDLRRRRDPASCARDRPLRHHAHWADDVAPSSATARSSRTAWSAATLTHAPRRTHRATHYGSTRSTPSAASRSASAPSPTSTRRRASTSTSSSSTPRGRSSLGAPTHAQRPLLAGVLRRTNRRALLGWAPGEMWCPPQQILSTARVTAPLS